MDSDYNNGIFKVNIDYEKKIKSLMINYLVYLEEPEIESRINRGEASIVIHIENSQTKYREIVYINEMEGSFELDLASINGNIELMPAIVSNRDITDFTSEDFIDDYLGEKITLEKGNFIAVDYETIIAIDKDIQDEVDVPSIITLSNKEDQKEAVSFDYSSDRIYIYMNQKTWENYHALRGSGKTYVNIFNAITILPALSEAIKYVKDPDTEDNQFSDRRWFRSMRVILENQGYDMVSTKFLNEDNYIIAQNLLNNMIESSIDSLNGMKERIRT